MKLTAKQEKFAQGVANGKTLADAYRNAYNAENMANSTIWRNASALAKNNKVATRVKELQQITRDKFLWTREMSVKALANIYATGQRDNNLTAMTQAVKELNAMHGYNAPDKIDVTSHGSPLRPSEIKIVGPKN